MRTITVKGVSKVTVKPDYIEITMKLEAKGKLYAKVMEPATEQLSRLNKALEAIGFEKDSLKTSNFDIQANQERRKDIRGNIQWVFSEFVCKHQLKLSFDLDMDKLAQVLSTIAKCLAYPELNIAFTIKDTAALNEALLRETAMNAKHKAELLCEASDVKLGQLLTIDYDWKEFNIYSETNIDFMHQYSYDSSPKTKYMKMEPDSIHIKDTANYIWEIM